VLKQLVVDDHVVCHWEGNGTHQGELAGLAPTGKSITIEGISSGCSRRWEPPRSRLDALFASRLISAPDSVAAKCRPAQGHESPRTAQGSAGRPAPRGRSAPPWTRGCPSSTPRCSISTSGRARSESASRRPEQASRTTAGRAAPRSADRRFGERAAEAHGVGFRTEFPIGSVLARPVAAPAVG
jgi:hypothetical protein